MNTDSSRRPNNMMDMSRDKSTASSIDMRVGKKQDSASAEKNIKLPATIH